MRALIISLLLLLGLNACGTKGPLYIPEKQYPLDPADRKPMPKSPKQDSDVMP